MGVLTQARGAGSSCCNLYYSGLGMLVANTSIRNTFLELLVRKLFIHHGSGHIPGINRCGYRTHHAGIVSTGKNPVHRGLLKRIRFDMSLLGKLAAQLNVNVSMLPKRNGGI